MGTTESWRSEGTCEDHLIHPPLSDHPNIKSFLLGFKWNFLYFDLCPLPLVFAEARFQRHLCYFEEVLLKWAFSLFVSPTPSNVTECYFLIVFLEYNGHWRKDWSFTHRQRNIFLLKHLPHSTVFQQPVSASKL